jgi:hypothetical protein
MLGFQVSLNGKQFCTAAVGETGVLNAMVTWVSRSAPGVLEPSDLRVQVGGLNGGEQMEWAVPRNLQIGDEVFIKVVITEAPDPPTRTQRDDRALVEAEERNYYERLKAKYEG